jgi:hypothetical protein
MKGQLIFSIAISGVMLASVGCRGTSQTVSSDTAGFGSCTILTGEDALRADGSIQQAAKLLGRDLSVKQMDAIQRAHIAHADEITEESVQDGTAHYSDQALQDKYAILADAGFTKPEIKVLMDKNIVGFLGALADVVGAVAVEALKQDMAQNQDSWNRPFETPTQFFPEVSQNGLGTVEKRHNWLSGKDVEVERDLFGNITRRRECDSRTSG